MTNALSRLQLRHFRLIGAIDQTGQLSAAAEVLGMTQPAASRSLAEIEDAVGEPVFLRHPKGMTPNGIGEILVRHAAIVLSDLEAAEEELLSVQAGRSGTVRVGAVTAAAVTHVVPAVRTLQAEADRPKIHVDVAPSVDLMDGLLGGRFDFVLCRVPAGVDVTRLDSLHTRDEHLDLLVRRDHPLAGQTLHLRQLTGAQWVMQASGMPIRTAVEDAHLAAGLPLPGDVIDSASLLFTMAYLRKSDAVSPVAREVSDLIRHDGPEGYVALDLDRPIAMPPYNLLRLAGHPLGPVAQRLLEIVHGRMAG